VKTDDQIEITLYVVSEYFDQGRKDGKMFEFQTIYAPQGLV